MQMERQMAANPQTKPTTSLGCASASMGYRPRPPSPFLLLLSQS